MGNTAGEASRASAACACALPLAVWMFPGPAMPTELPAMRPPAGTREVALPAPEGNFRVTVAVSGPRNRPVAVFAEQRRLMAEDIRLRGNRPVTLEFIVNVRHPELDALPANATGGTRVRLSPSEEASATWDDALTVSVTEPGMLVSVRARRVEVPTLHLAGDSTVADQSEAPDASWGQFLTRYFRDDIAIANHAQSGASLNSFVTGLRFAKLLATLRAGDWVMIQFGHNDQKTQWPQTYAEAGTTYRAWLRLYIEEVRRRGATPVLVTSPERRHFDGAGRIRPSLAEHAQAVREVAREQKVALVDLQAASIRYYEALGPALAPQAFADRGNDITHHNEYGARQLARAVIEGLRKADPSLTAGLHAHIAPDTGRFDASDPPLPGPPRRQDSR